MELISLVEYAKLNGISSATARQRAIRGSFKTARKMGRDWIIDKNEPMIDHRKKENVKMKNTLEMQYTENGEWFEIWNTEQTNLELAWKEMDEQPTESGWIRFKGGKEFLVIHSEFE